jgi:hypothetical protein
LKLACSTSSVRRDDTMMMMMMMALTNHTNHSKHTQKPTQKNTHKNIHPLTHSLTHAHTQKNTLGNFAQNSVLQKNFSHKQTKKLQMCPHSEMMGTTACSPSIYVHKRRRVLEGDRRGRGESQKQRRRRTTVGTRKTRSSRTSQPHAHRRPSATSTTSVGRLFRGHVHNLRVLLRATSFSTHHTGYQTPDFVVSG